MVPETSLEYIGIIFIQLKEPFKHIIHNNLAERLSENTEEQQASITFFTRVDTRHRLVLAFPWLGWLDWCCRCGAAGQPALPACRPGPRTGPARRSPRPPSPYLPINICGASEELSSIDIKAYRHQLGSMLTWMNNINMPNTREIDWEQNLLISFLCKINRYSNMETEINDPYKFDATAYKNVNCQFFINLHTEFTTIKIH